MSANVKCCIYDCMEELMEEEKNGISLRDIFAEMVGFDTCGGNNFVVRRMYSICL